jgi:hypothetical protein
MKSTRLQASAGLRRRALLPFCAALAVTLAGCAGTGGLGSVSKTTQLQQGMSEVQVQQVLGAPGRVQMGAQGAIWTYSLHEYFKGWVSHHLLFAGEPRQLQAWVADEAEYQCQQAQWLKMLSAMPAPAPAAKPSASGRPVGSAGHDDCQRKYYEDRIACLQAQIPR